MEGQELPRFTERSGHIKIQPLDAPSGPPEPFVRQWLDEQRVNGRSTRVLDVGCGRGGRVAWLCSQGFDAWGVEVTGAYADAGTTYFEKEGLGRRLLMVKDDGTYPLGDRSFDVVLSDQVFEHVADLEVLANEIARVSRPGATGLHTFPARWNPLEPHMYTPFAHWVPKGKWRRRALAAALSVGADAHYFPEFSLSDRVSIYNCFSENETFYRRPREILTCLNRSGLKARFVEGEKLKKSLVSRGMRVAKVIDVARPVAGSLYRTFRCVYVETVRG